MANEAGGLGMDGLEEGGGVRQDVNKVTEEAVRRVQESQKKAKQVQQQIQDDKQNNSKFAHFLTFLIQTVTNDTLITRMYETFFKTKHPKTDIVYLRKNINTIVIVGMFAPFYPTEITNFGLKGYFEKIHSFQGYPTVTTYVHYLKDLSRTYHDNIPIDKVSFISFLVELLLEYNVVNRSKMTEEEKNELKTGLIQELYGETA